MVVLLGCAIASPPSPNLVLLIVKMLSLLHLDNLLELFADAAVPRAVFHGVDSHAIIEPGRGTFRKQAQPRSAVAVGCGHGRGPHRTIPTPLFWQSPGRETTSTWRSVANPFTATSCGNSRRLLAKDFRPFLRIRPSAGNNRKGGHGARPHDSLLSTAGLAGVPFGPQSGQSELRPGM